MDHPPRVAAADPGGARRSPWRRPLSIALSVAIVVAVFAFAIPKIADYGAVLDTLRDLTWIELWSLLLATVFNLFTYWIANMCALPGLGLWRAAVITQTTTLVANTLPAGGAIAVGLTFDMLHSWGFTATQSTLYVAVTGVWNIFMKLLLPVVSVVVLALTGQGSGAFVVAAMVGLLTLGLALGVFAAILWKEDLARRIGDLGGRAIGFLLKPFHRDPPAEMGERAARFRRGTMGLIGRRWLPLTLATILSHLALFFVLLLSLRHVGVSAADVSTAQVLAVFAFGRLISALPVTPGGLGVIELGYIGGLVAAGGARPEIVAGVLLFRLLTYVLPIPLGGITYLIWKRNKSWRRPVPSQDLRGTQTGSVTTA